MTLISVMSPPFTFCNPPRWWDVKGIVMLENYFDKSSKTEQEAIQKNQRLLAVQAALEIAKASAGASGANARTDKVEEDLKFAAEKIGPLADAIQQALAK